MYSDSDSHAHMDMLQFRASSLEIWNCPL